MPVFLNIGIFIVNSTDFSKYNSFYDDKYPNFGLLFLSFVILYLYCIIVFH